MMRTTITNPVIWADFPDNDVIRDGNAFYMVTTSMHSMPGCPIMKSYNLKDWSIVSYVYDTFEDNDAHNLKGGMNIYGKGSWAASLRKIGEWYCCLFNCNDTGHSYLYKTKDIEKSGWDRYELDEYMHDASMLVDDDGVYIMYGNGDIFIKKLNAELTAIDRTAIDKLLFSTPREQIMLRCEGCHAYKINGRYYAIFIEWPFDGNKRRRQVCYRFDSFEGPFERKIILDDDMGFFNRGVAQGAIFNLPDEKRWAAVFFQDHGAVGRIPIVLPVEWVDGWPIPGIDGRVPKSFELVFDDRPDNSGVGMQDDHRETVPAFTENLIVVDKGIPAITGTNFDLSPGGLNYKWQWNHNPDNTAWSCDERIGWLRLKNNCITDRVTQARNTLTQRTFGPECSASVRLDYSGMKPGDCAGLVAMAGEYGLIGVRAEASGLYRLVVAFKGEDYLEQVVAEKIITSDSDDAADHNSELCLKIEFDFSELKDNARFYYSFDGENWEGFGPELHMRYTLDHFMGYRIGYYSYATKLTGGYADFTAVCE